MRALSKVFIIRSYLETRNGTYAMAYADEGFDPSK